MEAETLSEEVILADTNVVSFIFKEDTRSAFYTPHIENKLTGIAAQTLAELEALPLLNAWSKRRHNLLTEYVRNNYVLLEADEKVCLKWALIQAEAKKLGKPVAVGDAWIAATALTYSIPLITHNPKHFSNISGLKVITEQK